jgi:hypothetical protein
MELRQDRQGGAGVMVVLPSCCVECGGEKVSSSRPTLPLRGRIAKVCAYCSSSECARRLKTFSIPPIGTSRKPVTTLRVQAAASVTRLFIPR